MTVVGDLNVCIETTDQVNSINRPIAARDGHFNRHLWLNALLKAGEIKSLLAVQAKRLPANTWRELQRQYPHPNEVRAMNTFKTFDQNRSDAQ